jgi:hypothetical protein
MSMQGLGMTAVCGATVRVRIGAVTENEVPRWCGLLVRLPAALSVDLVSIDRGVATFNVAVVSPARLLSQLALLAERVGAMYTPSVNGEVALMLLDPERRRRAVWTAQAPGDSSAAVPVPWIGSHLPAGARPSPASEATPLGVGPSRWNATAMPACAAPRSTSTMTILRDYRLAEVNRAPERDWGWRGGAVAAGLRLRPWLLALATVATGWVLVRG